MRTFFGHVLKGLQTVLQSLNISFMSNVSLSFLLFLSSSGEQYVGGG